MKVTTIDSKEIETQSIREPDMEASIVNTMHRYFQNDSGKPSADLEHAILDSVKRYFESPKY